MKLPLALLATPLLFACAHVQAEEEHPPCEAQTCVGLGEVGDLGEIAVIPLEVLEDSRCPINARCVWAGQVRLKISMIYRNGREEHEITDGEPIDIRWGKLQLVEVLPVPLAGEREPAEYRFGFNWLD